MRYVAFLLIVLFFYGCENEKGKERKIIVKQEEIQVGLQEQLDEEFGDYKENVRPEDLEYYKAYDKALKLWKVPFHETYIQTSFGKAHVIVSGPKNTETVVLLHGMDASSTMWYPNIKAISQNHRVYCIDLLLEPGKSQINREVKDMKDILTWYNEIFDRLKLKKFSLIGASRGGWLAVNIALHQKSRIENIILLSPAQTFKWIRPGAGILSGIAYSLNPKRRNLRGTLETVSFNYEKIEGAYIEQYFIATQKAKNFKFILQMMPFSDKELKSLTIPVLVLIGDHDIINNDNSIEKAKELLPQSETGIIKDAGHFLSFDQPEIVNNRMLNFLGRTL